MLSNSAATQLINLIKTDIADSSEALNAAQAYQEIYNYLNYAGGQTLTPAHLKHYRKILAIFQNPCKVLTELPINASEALYFQQTELLQEIQTLTLLWLRAASNHPTHSIDLNCLLQEAQRTLH